MGTSSPTIALSGVRYLVLFWDRRDARSKAFEGSSEARGQRNHLRNFRKGVLEGCPVR